MTNKTLAMLAMALTSGISSPEVDSRYQFRNLYEPLPEPFAKKGWAYYLPKLIYGVRGGGISRERLKQTPRRYCMVNGDIRNKRKLLGSR